MAGYYKVKETKVKALEKLAKEYGIKFNEKERVNKGVNKK